MVANWDGKTIFVLVSSLLFLLDDLDHTFFINKNPLVCVKKINKLRGRHVDKSYEEY